MDGFFPLPSCSIEKAKFLFMNGRSGQIPDEDDDDMFLEGSQGRDEETEVFLIAERPSVAQRRSSWIHRRLSSGSRKKRKLHFSSQDGGCGNVALPEVTILSVNSFCRHEQEDDEEEGNGLINPNRYKNFTKCKRRQYSIPNLLMNVSAPRECVMLGREHRLNSFNASQLEDLQTIGQIPRSRLVSIVADRLQQRPVYAPCHPIDLEGLQETAV